MTNNKELAKELEIAVVSLEHRGVRDDAALTKIQTVINTLNGTKKDTTS